MLFDKRECVLIVLSRPSTRFRSGSVRTRFTTSLGAPNPEPDFRSGSASMLNFEPDFGPVRKGSGPNRSSEPDSRNTIPNMRICVMSQPEADIELVLSPLAFRSVSLHGEKGQAQDIAEYVKFVVSTDRNMKKWRKEDKELVVQELTRRADGM